MVVRSQAAVKGTVNGGLRPGPLFPRRNGASPGGGRVVALRRRLVGWCGLFPWSRRQPDGYSAGPRESSPRRCAGRAGGGWVCANLTPEARHCRRSPADVTEGNKPKTSQGSDDPGVGVGCVVASGRRSAPSIVKVPPVADPSFSMRSASAQSVAPPWNALPERSKLGQARRGEVWPPATTRPRNATRGGLVLPGSIRWLELLTLTPST